MAGERMTVREVAKALGVCKGRILREYVRTGALPWPDGAATWARADVEALMARFDAERATRAAR